MTISISRKQITDLARTLDLPGKSYLQKLDLIATSFGFPNQAAMMATVKDEGAPSKEAPEGLFGTIADHRDETLLDLTDEPILPPVRFLAQQSGPAAVDVFIGGAEKDYYAVGASSVRIERQGNMTRFMLYDACCDSPRTFAVPDDGPMIEAPNDWESTPRQDEPEDDLEPSA